MRGRVYSLDRMHLTPYSLIGDIIELALKDFVDMVWTCIFIKSDVETMLDSAVMIEA
jgi:hypothetical protein